MIIIILLKHSSVCRVDFPPLLQGGVGGYFVTSCLGTVYQSPFEKGLLQKGRICSRVGGGRGANSSVF